MVGTAVFRMGVSSDSMKKATAMSQGRSRLDAIGEGGRGVAMMQIRSVTGAAGERVEIDFVFLSFLPVGLLAFDFGIFLRPLFAKVLRQVDFLHGSWFVWIAHTLIRIQP